MEKIGKTTIIKFFILLFPIINYFFIWVSGYFWGSKTNIYLLIFIGYVLPILYIIFSFWFLIKNGIKKNVLETLVFFIIYLPLIIFFFIISNVRWM